MYRQFNLPKGQKLNQLLKFWHISLVYCFIHNFAACLSVRFSFSVGKSICFPPLSSVKDGNKYINWVLVIWQHTLLVCVPFVNQMFYCLNVAEKTRELLITEMKYILIIWNSIWDKNKMVFFSNQNLRFVIQPYDSHSFFQLTKKKSHLEHYNTLKRLYACLSQPWFHCHQTILTVLNSG